jgi:DNA-binding ferritin-like protein
MSDEEFAKKSLPEKASMLDSIGEELPQLEVALNACLEDAAKIGVEWRWLTPNELAELSARLAALRDAAAREQAEMDAKRAREADAHSRAKTTFEAITAAQKPFEEGTPLTEICARLEKSMGDLDRVSDELRGEIAFAESTPPISSERLHALDSEVQAFAMPLRERHQLTLDEVAERRRELAARLADIVARLAQTRRVIDEAAALEQLSASERIARLEGHVTDADVLANDARALVADAQKLGGAAEQISADVPSAEIESAARTLRELLAAAKSAEAEQALRRAAEIGRLRELLLALLAAHEASAPADAVQQLASLKVQYTIASSSYDW